MQKIENDSIEGLEKGNNIPIVMSPFGFKEGIFDGKTYLVPMTQEEYIICIQNDKELTEEQQEKIIEGVKNKTGYCQMASSMYCVSFNGCTWCRYVTGGGVRFCECIPMP